MNDGLKNVSGEEKCIADNAQANIDVKGKALLREAMSLVSLGSGSRCNGNGSQGKINMKT